MSSEPNFCSSCGTGLKNSPTFCPTCGSLVKNVNQISEASTLSSDGFFKRYWRRSVKARLFYGSWVLLNVANGINLIVSSSAPKDRFRSICEWEGVNCPPSAEEQALQSLLNLVVWNLFFWTFRYIYKKRQTWNRKS
jgi:hypothetical protein